jgi:hypothetical protein
VSLEVRGEGDGSFAGEAPGGKDIPDIFGEDVDGEVVDLFGSVLGPAKAVQLAEVAGSEPHLGGLYLDAQEAAVEFEDDVIAGRLSPGLGDAEAAAVSEGHEEKLRPLAAALVAGENLFAWTPNSQWFPRKIEKAQPGLRLLSLYNSIISFRYRRL